MLLKPFLVMALIILTAMPSTARADLEDLGDKFEVFDKLEGVGDTIESVGDIGEDVSDTVDAIFDLIGLADRARERLDRRYDRGSEREWRKYEYRLENERISTVARIAHVSPRKIRNLRADGVSWSSICRRYDIPPHRIGYGRNSYASYDREHDRDLYWNYYKRHDDDDDDDD